MSMARRSALRASDSDRDHVAQRLRDATAEGRLLASELEERLTALFSSRTYGELDALVSDLPALDAGRRHRASRSPLWMRIAFAAAVLMAVLAVMATVALLVLGIAGAWVAWMLIAWMVFGRRRRCVHGGRSRPHAEHLRRQPETARVHRGRTAAL